jgi:hypothetical protein
MVWMGDPAERKTFGAGGGGGELRGRGGEVGVESGRAVEF